MSKAFVIAEINLRQIKAAYYISGSTFLLFFSIATYSPANLLVSAGNTLIILPVIAAILIPAINFRKIINLGGKRHDFFIGALFVYMLLSVFVALINLLFYYNTDISYPADYIEATASIKHYDYSYTIIEVIGFFRRSVVVAFIQMFAFLASLSAFTHTLVSIQGQGKWYVWVTTPTLILIAAVFIISPEALVSIFENARNQITICLLLAAVLYALSKPVLERKEI